MSKVDVELSQLNIPAVLRANAALMKILVVLFHYGNQAMDAKQLVLGIENLKLLELKGDADETIRGIISSANRQAKRKNMQPPLEIIRARMGRPARYNISKETLNGVQPISTQLPLLNYSGAKRERKATLFYSPYEEEVRPGHQSPTKPKKQKKKETPIYLSEDDEEDFDYSEFVFGGPEGEKTEPLFEEEDTIEDYSLLYSPPPQDMSYIDSIEFDQYPPASHFAVVQQKGYSYPRFRSHEKHKIPKVNCEDKFRVTDIKKQGKTIGRLFILADGHGGPGCSEFFVRHTPKAVNQLCAHYTHLDWTDRHKQQFVYDIKRMILHLDQEYLDGKRVELKKNECADNDGCTLILNIFLGYWMINVNVGDSRTIVMSAPIPKENKPNSITTGGVLGIDSDYKMDVVFASQDHKPYLAHLAREILENGGEFVDSVQNRVIKVEADKLKDDRCSKRGSLKNARIRPRGSDTEGCGGIGEKERIPSLNVARSCGDLDFKMDPEHKIISCEPDVTFVPVKKDKQRYFLFMSTDGTFDYMFEETPEKQNRAIARLISTMIEDGEKAGKYLLQEEEKEDQKRKEEYEKENEGERLQIVIENMEDINQNDPKTINPKTLPIPLLYRELSEEETNERKVKERTLVLSARHFANREGSQGFFASTVQDYDDCTIILAEI
ncbi:phosphatase 2C-like domain-containing protein [Sporodiniella umbellata]|nr:phosphatase 2C-like domain-containing protein [Sporodiniella umbellata]